MAREARRAEPQLQQAAPPVESKAFEKQAAKTPGQAAYDVAASPEAIAEEEALPAPDAWIDELLRLQAAGDTEALDAGIEAFRAAYPDFPLPDALRDGQP